MYTRDDGAEPEVVEQRALVDMAYDLRDGSEADYREYQRQLMILDRLTGGPG